MLTYITNEKELKILLKINEKCNKFDEVIFQSIEFSSKETTLKLEDMIKISSSLPDNIKKYFSIDIIPFNKDIQNIKILLNTLVKNNFYGVKIEDLSILNIIENNNLKLKIILDSTTGGNNINYYNFFLKFKSIERIMLSRELTLDKIIKYGKNSKINLGIQAYGLLQIFHTKRKLIKAIQNNLKKNTPKLLYLKEPKRENESFPLLETNNGTIMFHSKIINLYDYKNKLQELNIHQLIDLRHIKNSDSYKKILSHYCNVKNYDLSKIETLPFLELLLPEENNLPKYLNKSQKQEKLIEIGVVLDSKKGKEIILKSKIELKLDIELIFYNNKGKELTYNIKYLNKFGKSVYIIPWRKGVTSNSKFYIRNYE